MKFALLLYGDHATLNGLDDELPRHPLVPATRAEFLHRLGSPVAAVVPLRRAITLTTNDSETRFLRDRLDAWSDRSR